MSLETERNGQFRVLIPDGKHAGDKVAGLLHKGGIPVEWRTNGGLHVKFNGNEGDLSFTVIKNRIIPAFIAEGRYPAAFTTSDRVADYISYATLVDKNLSTDIIEVAKFQEFNPRLRVSLLTRDNQKDNERYQTPEDLRGQRVLTSYIGLGTRFFRACFPNDEELPIDFDARIDGKEEGLVEEGDAEAAIVSVDSGSAMNIHHLRELAVVIPRGECQIVLVCNSRYLEDEGNKSLIDQFVGRLQNGNDSNGVNKPSEALKIEDTVKTPATGRFKLDTISNSLRIFSQMLPK